MALNIGLDASFDNMPNWEGIQGKTEEVYVTQDEMMSRILNRS
jgi:hypothetical protein